MPRSFSEQTGTFQRLLVLFKGFLPRLQKSFFCLSAWRSSIIPHPRLIVNTFFHLFCLFSIFLFKHLFPRTSVCCASPQTADSRKAQLRRTCLRRRGGQSQKSNTSTSLSNELDNPSAATYHRLIYYTYYK